MAVIAARAASAVPRKMNPQKPSLVRSSSLSILPSSFASDVLTCPLSSAKLTRISSRSPLTDVVRSAIALVLNSVALEIDSTAVLISLMSMSVAWVIILVTNFVDIDRAVASSPSIDLALAFTGGGYFDYKASYLFP